MQNLNLDSYYRRIIERLDKKSPYLVLHNGGKELSVKAGSIIAVGTKRSPYSSKENTVIIQEGVYGTDVDGEFYVDESPEDIKLMLKVAGHMFIRKDADNGTISYEQ